MPGHTWAIFLSEVVSGVRKGISEMAMPAIKTKYNFCQYRSRLEAHWAAFFDLLGWKFEYEPYDLNGWIPDFALIGGDEILVEVKPFFNFTDFDLDKIMAAIKNTDKNKKEILLLGGTVFDGFYHDITLAPAIGWVGEYFYPGEKIYFNEAILNKYQGLYGFFHSSATRQDKMTLGNINTPPSRQEILGLWNTAKNKVMWKK